MLPTSIPFLNRARLTITNRNIRYRYVPEKVYNEKNEISKHEINEIKLETLAN